MSVTMAEMEIKELNTLELQLSSGTKIVEQSKPLFFNVSERVDREKLSKLFEAGKVQHVRDEYRAQQLELFGIQNPTLVRTPDYGAKCAEYTQALQAKQPSWQQGVWVYFPWISTLSHILPEEEFFIVRTARNQELISKEEQKKYYNGVVGVGGLSVGNSAALAIVLSGGARHIKLADFDTLDLSNLNRIRAGVDVLGVPKVEVTARQIYLLNPYAEVEIFPLGLTKETMQEFFVGLDVMIDELDSLEIKYLVRDEAKKQKIPIVMAADCAESGIVDVERYDLTPQPEFFHGRLGDITYEQLLGLDKRAIGGLIARHVGIENHNERMLESLEALGKTIVSWPQLGPTALLNSAAIAYCVRQILTQKPLIDNRAIISLEEHLDPSYSDSARVSARKSAIEKFRIFLGIQ